MREPHHVVSDLGDKAGGDVVDAAGRVASLLDDHKDRFVVMSFAAAALFGACVAQYQMMRGATEMKPATKRESDAVVRAILAACAKGMTGARRHQ